MKPLSLPDTDPMLADGVYDGTDQPRISADTYHSSARLSRGDLVDLTLPNTPRDFMFNRQTTELPTAAMVRGSALHAAIMEPDLFGREFALMPLDAKRTSKDDKRRVDEFLAEAHAEGKLVVGWDYRKGQLALSEVTAVIEVSKAVREDEYVRRMLQGPGLTEVSAAWTEGDVHKRARIDRTYYGPDGPVAIDLKSAGKRGGAWGPVFAREIASRHLEMQAAHYLDGLTAATGEEHKHWLFLVYECEAPFKVALHPLSEDAIEEGRRRCAAATELFRRCRDSNEWPGYPREFADLDLPAWAKK